MKFGLLIFILMAVSVARVATGTEHAERFQKVVAMNPAGYWPLDDSGGTTVRDLSNNSNDGKLYHVGWVNGLADFKGAYQWIEVPAHAAYQTDAFSAGGWVYLRSEVYGGGWPNRQGMLLIGNREEWLNRLGFQLAVRRENVPEIVSSGIFDPLETHMWCPDERRSLSDIRLPVGKWHHLIYTFDFGQADSAVGTGVLYLNGEEIGRADGIAYKSVNRELQMGNDAAWWHMSIRSGSLDGSLRDMVWFDRALSADEVNELYAITRPTTKPIHKAEETVVEEPWENGDALLSVIENEENAKEERALAVMDLAKQGSLSTQQIERLQTLYQKVVAHDGALRIEDILSNGLTRLLLDTDREGVVTRELLGIHFARPFLKSLDLEADELASVREHFAEGNYMDALDEFRRSEPGERSDYFFTHRRPQDRDYTPIAEFDGVTYIVGEGVGWRAIEPVDADAFEEILSRLEVDYPDVREWRPIDFPNLYRVTLTRVAQDGSEETVYLGGEDFVLDGTDAKLRGWSILVDEEGYIHLVGGQHNRPVSDYYIPGSWESIGASRDPESGSFPRTMYWVSARPGSFDNMVFVGHRDNPRAIPTDNLNYMVLLHDNTYQTYMYGRVYAFGWQSWGLFNYDVETQRWQAIGGEPIDVIRSIEDTHPGWLRLATHEIRGRGLPDRPAGTRPLAWAWQPAFYNFCRDDWGARFDRTGRLHIHMQIFGLDLEGFNRKSSVYAWSDDFGQTFHRANGTPVRLPLTLNPAPEYNADIKEDNQWDWWRLWTSLIREAGFDVPHFSLERVARY